MSFVVIAMLAAVDVWMIYCIWFRREPTSLMEVTKVCELEEERRL